MGLSFAGHVPLDVTMDEGAASGITSIEHLSEFRVFRECTGEAQPYDAERCRPLFETLAANNVWHTPTLGFYRVLLNVSSRKPTSLGCLLPTGAKLRRSAHAERAPLLLTCCDCSSMLRS